MVLVVHLHSSPLVLRNDDINGQSVQPVDIIGIKQERKLLIQCIKDSNKPIEWRTEVADPHTFRKAISYRCRILHFSGHGIENQIVFENGKCEAHLLSESDLKNLLTAGVSDPTSSPLELAFISACHSESVANAFLEAGVQHVIVVAKDDRVLDKKALEFAQAFYTALFSGHTVYESFQIGQVQANICSPGTLPGDATFKLLGRGNHNKPMFNDLACGEFVDSTPPLPINESDSVAEFFVGRSIEVHKVYTSLVEGSRMITLTGLQGIGKTEIALQCTQYATDRYLFQRIFFVRINSKLPASGIQRHNRVMRKIGTCFGMTNLNGEPETIVADIAAAARRKCNEGNFLLVLDGCETLLDDYKESFRKIVGQLVRRVPTLSLLLTSVRPLGSADGVGERIIEVGNLSKLDSAMLLAVRSPRKLQQVEIGSDLNTLSESSVIEALGGHPRVICRLAQELTALNLVTNLQEIISVVIPRIWRAEFPDMTISRVRSHFLDVGTSDAESLALSSLVKQIRPYVNDYYGAVVWAQALQLNQTREDRCPVSVEGPIPFECLRQPLCRYFSTVVQGDAVQRPLSSRTLEFFRQSTILWGASGESPASSQNYVAINMFSTFWNWFDNVLPCLRSTGLWGHTSPRRLHGFLSKQDTMQMLRGMPPGTFLLRFSESRIRCLAVAYVREHGTTNCIQFVHIDYAADTEMFETQINENAVKFPTISQLILNVTALVLLYPNIPKSDVFKS